MALVKTSGIAITEISGKVGGSVFARNKGGNTVKNRVKGTNPKTNKQLAQRAQLSNNASAWRDLTDAERAAWNQAAASGEWPYQNRLGETSQQSGSQLYSRLNNNLTSIGATVIATPPLKVAFPVVEDADFQVVYDTGIFTVTFGYTPGPVAPFFINLFCSPPVGQGIGRAKSLRQTKVNVAGSGFFLETEYVDIFGFAPLDSKVFADAYLVNSLTGQKELFFSSFFITQVV